MSESETLRCADETRRQRARQVGLNGLDYVEVSADQRTLTLYFLQKAPANLDSRNFVIQGGRRVRNIAVTGVKVNPSGRKDRDDSVDLTVSEPGDFSIYTLRVVEPPREGHPLRPLGGFDPRYAALEFSFKAGCPSDLDCAPTPCPPEPRPPSDVNYLARDYQGFRQLLLDRLAVTLPEWRERHVPDLGITLVELLAYVGDYLSQYQDAVATEAYLGTARQRISVRRHARLVDYAMHEGCNARAWVAIETDADFPLDLAGTQFSTRPETLAPERTLITQVEFGSASGGAVVFEPLRPAAPGTVIIRAGLSILRFHTWANAECCLEKGATSATLRDEWVAAPPVPAPAADTEAHARSGRTTRLRGLLKPGDVLIFEEVIGPRTGDTADADPHHRHAVRLTEVRYSVDPIPEPDGDPAGVPVVEIRWAPADALSFALCLSSTKPAPDCGPLGDVSVAHGNVILVDHGSTTTEPVGPVPGENPEPTCDPCEDTAPEDPGSPFRPRLANVPVTFRATLVDTAPAAQLLTQDPRQAKPEIMLGPIRKQTAGIDEPDLAQGWSPVLDLLGSLEDDRVFVVEIDNEGFAHLRFGDGDLGLVPPRGTMLEASLRLGNGSAGNVGAESIALLVTRDRLSVGGRVRVRNPLPAIGGTEPESITQVKLLSPGAFRSRRERAVIAADYAELVERDFTREVQGAAAILRWTGSWYNARTGVDALGVEQAPPALVRRVAARLHRYRRIGHDLSVGAASKVPLAITLAVCVAPHVLRAGVKVGLLELFSNRRFPDGRPGLFHPDNLRYGQSITVSSLLAATLQVPGVASAAVTQLERQGEGDHGAIDHGELKIGPLEIAQLDNDPRYPEQGVLTISLDGGR